MPFRPFGQTVAGAALALCISTSPVFADSLQKPELLLVSTAEALVFDGDTVIFSGLNPEIVWFTDRPERQSGHITPARFLEAWHAGADSFAGDPPNAVLTMEGHVGAPVIVELSNPRLDGTTMTYDISVLHGALPAKAGTNSIVFDSKIIGIDLVP